MTTTKWTYPATPVELEQLVADFMRQRPPGHKTTPLAELVGYVRQCLQLRTDRSTRGLRQQIRDYLQTNPNPNGRRSLS